MSKLYNFNKQTASINDIIVREAEKGSRYKSENVTIPGVRSFFSDPYLNQEGYYGGLKTADRLLNRAISCRTLRRVASKAWILSACKMSILRQIEPYLKPITAKNYRGFVILKDGEEIKGKNGEKPDIVKQMEKLIMNTGSVDGNRDTFSKYITKIFNDHFDIDQIATEIQFNKSGKPIAFYAVDAATIEKVLPNQENPDELVYMQVIDCTATAAYKKNEMIFDYKNARTDVYYSYYGNSITEQSIDLVTTLINAFVYNSGNFTDNKLPRGMLLIDGDASQETVELMEEYLFDVMSGTPASQWRIPIIPSGSTKEEGGNKIKFEKFNVGNREMEFQAFFDLLLSAVCSLAGVSIDILGLHSAKAQAMFDGNGPAKFSNNKGNLLGDNLGYLQQYINQILKVFDESISIEFVGYERDDPKDIADLEKKQVDAVTGMNEIRASKGLPPIDLEKITNAADLPMNVQLIQIWQSMQAAKQGMDAMGGDFENEYEQDSGEQNQEEDPDFEHVIEKSIKITI